MPQVESAPALSHKSCSRRSTACLRQAYRGDDAAARPSTWRASEHRLEGQDRCPAFELDGDLLGRPGSVRRGCRRRGLRPCAFRPPDVELEAAREFASLEVVGLIHNGHGVGRVGQPNAFRAGCRRQPDRARPRSPRSCRCGCSPEYPLRRVSPAASGISRIREDPSRHWRHMQEARFDRLR